MKLLIDGDIVVYSCGFASDTRVYTCPDGAEYTYKKEADAHCKANSLPKEDITKTVTHAPVDEVLKKTHRFVRDLREACDQAEEYEIFLSGKDNFREKAAVTVPYKGNRDDTAKPHHYQAIREYLVESLGAVIIDGMEADDAMGIEQCAAEAETCIVTIDKDLNMIPGLHFNWQKDSMYNVTRDEADYFFHKQMLTGDRIDNIIGLHKVGDKTADKMLTGKSFDERGKIIADAYTKEFGGGWTTRLEENTQLLWILREPLNDTPLDRAQA